MGTSYSFMTSNENDPVFTALGHAEGLRCAVIAMMRAISAGHTGDNVYAHVAADLEAEVAQDEAFLETAPDIAKMGKPAKIAELKILIGAFRSS